MWSILALSLYSAAYILSLPIPLFHGEYISSDLIFLQILQSFVFLLFPVTFCHFPSFIYFMVDVSGWSRIINSNITFFNVFFFNTQTHTHSSILESDFHLIHVDVTCCLFLGKKFDNFNFNLYFCMLYFLLIYNQGCK